MRKLVSVSIVGAMVLSIMVGLFGGVVEEGEGTVSVIGDTIYIDNVENLGSIASKTNSSVFEYDIISGIAITHYNIHVNVSGILIINPGETLKFDSGRELWVDGILDAVGIAVDPINFISNSTSPTAGDWGQITLNGTTSSFSELIYVNVINGTVGIYCIDSSPTIIDTLIAGNLQRGMHIKNSSPTIERNQILNNGGPGNGGIYVEDSVFTVENCTLANSPYFDYIIIGNSNVTSLNSTFDDNEIDIIPPSEFTVIWYLDVLVKNNETGDPIQGAEVNIVNKTGVLVDGAPVLTDSFGYVRWLKIIEYTEKGSASNPDHTPHNITVTHPEYYSNYSIKNIVSSMEVPIFLDMILRDLTTNSDNITFNITGVPVAGEPFFVTVEVYNIEVDDAYDVRVVIIDDAPEGSQEIFNQSISIIMGMSSDDVSEKIELTPGSHTIEVYIDPYNEITEVNSDPFIDAENNNNAFIDISVNARPVINISEPVNNTEVNGTITIEGTSWDNPADNVIGLPGNDIARIDIRLMGYDWISLYPPFIFNISSGGWDWLYSWDTYYWNNTSLSDGNYTLQTRAWDNYHFSQLYEVNVMINNTGANEDPVAIINEPINNSHFSVNETIRFNGSLSYDPDNDPLMYEWDFDDGNFAYENVTYHSFSQIGMYNVTLIVNDSLVLSFSYVTVIINNTPPYAEITASSSEVFINETITFYGYNSTDEETPVLEFFWDYDNTTDNNGDGNFTNDIDNWTKTPTENTTHSYDRNGTYTVTLTVWDRIVNSTDTVIITIRPNAAPLAIIDQPNNGQFFDVNETILFNGNSSSDLNDEDLEYYWDFGDGNTYLENKTSYPDGEYDGKTTHYYSELGPFPTYSYTIILEVRDDEGLSDTDIVTIIVQNYPPVAIATSNVTTSPTNQDISFNGTDSYDPEGFGVTYLWNFGEGNTSTLGDTVHQFAQNGVYNVTLNVTDVAGGTDTDWIIITITNRAPLIESVSTYPDSPKIDEEIFFNITASDDDGHITKYEWDFGDVTSYFENETFYPDGAFDGKTTHSYTEKKSYTVIITIEDDYGDITTTELTITIFNTPPEITITSPVDGETVSGSITIQGTSSDIDGTVDKVEVSIDSGIWILADDDSGDWSLWSFPWDTEDGVTNGQHAIYARAYDTEDYTDPLTSISVTVDNIPTSISVTGNLNPSIAEAGGNVEVSGYVTYNTGEGVLGAVVNITIQNEAGYWTTTTDSNGLYTTDITAPGEADSFTVTIRAQKEGFTPVQTLKTLTVTALPDLTISASDIDFNPSAPYAGETVQITITVRNLGDVNANNVLVNAYDGDPNKGGDQIEPKGSDTVNVQKSGSADVFLSWDTTGESGEHFIYILVDPNNSIDESNENNNEASRAITVQGEPDFAIDNTDISFSKSNPREGDTISILVKIYNDGDETGTVKYEVYDGDPDDNGVLIDSGQESIFANGDETVTVEWTIEKSGDHDIYVVLDPDEEIDESDEGNNKAFNTIKVESKPSDEGVPAWFIALTGIIVIIVLILLYLLRFRERGPKEEKELPMAKVVQKDVKGTEKTEEEEEESKTLLESHGGVRI